MSHSLHVVCPDSLWYVPAKHLVRFRGRVRDRELRNRGFGWGLGIGNLPRSHLVKGEVRDGEVVGKDRVAHVVAVGVRVRVG